jgi:hypothetical protein
MSYTIDAETQQEIKESSSDRLAHNIELLEQYGEEFWDKIESEGYHATWLKALQDELESRKS